MRSPTSPTWTRIPTATPGTSITAPRSDSGLWSSGSAMGGRRRRREALPTSRDRSNLRGAVAGSGPPSADVPVLVIVRRLFRVSRLACNLRGQLRERHAVRMVQLTQQHQGHDEHCAAIVRRERDPRAVGKPGWRTAAAGCCTDLDTAATARMLPFSPEQPASSSRFGPAPALRA